MNEAARPANHHNRAYLCPTASRLIPKVYPLRFPGQALGLDSRRNVWALFHSDSGSSRAPLGRSLVGYYDHSARGTGGGSALLRPLSSTRLVLQQLDQGQQSTDLMRPGMHDATPRRVPRCDRVALTRPTVFSDRQQLRVRLLFHMRRPDQRDQLQLWCAKLRYVRARSWLGTLSAEFVGTGGDPL